MSADNYLLVDHDGEMFLVYAGSASDREDPDYEPLLYDTAETAAAAWKIVEGYGYVEYGTEWTDAAQEASGASLTDRAATKTIEQLSELNIKVVNLANKLDEHLKEVDAHHHVAVRGRMEK